MPENNITLIKSFLNTLGQLREFEYRYFSDIIWLMLNFLGVTMILWL